MRDVGYYIALAALGVLGSACITTRSDVHTLSPIVKGVRRVPGGLEVTKCAFEYRSEDREDCTTGILAAFSRGGGGGATWNNQSINETSCWVTLIPLEAQP